jgi:hypothetical protein
MRGDFQAATLPVPPDLLGRRNELARFSEWRIYSEQPLVTPLPSFHDGIEPLFVWDDLHLVPLVDGREANDSITVMIEAMGPNASTSLDDEVDEARRMVWAAHFDDIDPANATYHEMVKTQRLGGLFFIDADGYANAIVNAPELSQYDLFRAAYQWLTYVVRPHQAIAEYANWTPDDIEDLVLKELQTAGTILDSECIRYLARYPEALPEIHPRKFESLVASILRNQGFDVQLTPSSWDGGKDLVVLSRDTFGPIVTLVECKRYNAVHRVGVRQVREVLGVASIENVPRVAIVTSSSFTAGAHQLAAQQGGRLSLVDGDELVSWLKDVARWQMGETPGLIRAPDGKTEA